MIRQTRQRLAITKALTDAGRPLTAAEIHQGSRQYVERIGLRTVYRNIKEMQEDGLIVGIDYPGQPPRFEVVDAMGHRPHFICRGCNHMFRLEMDVPDIPYTPPPGFTIEGDEVIFYGRCPSCAHANDVN